MNQNPTEPPHVPRFRERLAETRYFTISVLLHVILLFVVGTIVLVKQQEDPFVPMTADIGDIDTDKFPEPKPQSPEEVPKDPTSTTAPATVVPPSSISESTPNIPVFNVVPNSQGIKINLAGDKFPRITTVTESPYRNIVPSEMGGRLDKDASNRIMGTGMPAGRRPTITTENAVIKGLIWLRDHQNKDGSWGEKNKGAMTGLALLCFLGHGELIDSKDYGLTVNLAVEWLLKNGGEFKGRLSMTGEDWGPGNSGVYEHAIATYALGEYFSMTKDERVEELLRKAVKYIVDGQGPDGGWMYRYDKTQSDTSVSGWQVQALKAAHLTKLNMPGVDAALDLAMKNFDRVQGPNGGYGYRGPEDRYSLTGVGVLCELFWRETRSAGLRRSIKFIDDKSEKEFPVRYQGEKGDLYAWYYHGQAMIMFGGGVGDAWNKVLSNEIVAAQTTDGAWPMMKAPGHGSLQDANNLTGQVYRTSLCVLMLEVYYRYMPIHRSETAPNPLKMAVR